MLKRRFIDILEPRRLFATGKVTGYFFIDANANGVFDGNDISTTGGATVWADMNLNGLLDNGEPSSVTTVVNGYSLTLNPGDYILRCTLPAGFQLSAPTNQAQWVHVTSGLAQLNVNFGG